VFLPVTIALYPDRLAQYPLMGFVVQGAVFLAICNDVGFFISSSIILYGIIVTLDGLFNHLALHPAQEGES
jgi:hypothetical protein